jgi:CRISPR-associated endonuclease Csn1
MHNDGVSGKVTLRRISDKAIPITKAIGDWKNIADRKVRSSVKSMLQTTYGGNLEALLKHVKKEGLTVEGARVEQVNMHYEFEATVKRVTLDAGFTEKQLEKITDTGIQKILRNHLKNFTLGNGHCDCASAFSQEGLEAMNKNIRLLNDGKDHKPIHAVRVYEVSQRFQVGQSPDSRHKYVEAAKGTNLFFTVYFNRDSQKRVFETTPFREVVEHQKQNVQDKGKNTSPVPLNANLGDLQFYLSPGDLVYNPTEEEIESWQLPDFTQLNDQMTSRIYRMEKATGRECYFIHHNVASLIAPYNPTSKFGEFQAKGKFEKFDNDSAPIKATCIKLKLDTLGTIVGYEGWTSD